MSEKYYTYILQCNDGTRYYGHTNNLKVRLDQHNEGLVSYTKRRKPVKLIYSEECSTRSEAFRREQQFKNGKTRKETLQKLIDNFAEAKCQGFNSHQ